MSDLPYSIHHSTMGFRTHAVVELDPRMREIGAANKKNVHSFLESLALYPMTRRLGMRDEEFDELITRARQEAEDHRLKPYLPLLVLPICDQGLQMMIIATNTVWLGT